MDRWITAEDAASRLGVSTQRVYQLAGRALRRRDTHYPMGLLEADVEQYAVMRREVIQSQGIDPVQVAKHARHVGPKTVKKGAARVLFGRSGLTAAARPATSGCRWCWARMSAEILGESVEIVDAPEWRTLLDVDPCPKDRLVWNQALTAAVAASDRQRQAREKREAEQKRAAEALRLEQGRRLVLQGQEMMRDASSALVAAGGLGPPQRLVEMVGRPQASLAYRDRLARQMQAALGRGELDFAEGLSRLLEQQ